jgi:hypothetical protein
LRRSSISWSTHEKNVSSSYLELTNLKHLKVSEGMGKFQIWYAKL